MDSMDETTLKFTSQSITPEMDRVFNALPFYVILVDANHEILYANQAVTSQFGIDRKKIIGEHCPTVIHGHTGAIPECPLEDSCKSGHPEEREIYDEKRGVWVTSAIYPTALATEKGSRVFFHIAYDISKRKQAEMDLKKSLERLRSVTEAGIQAVTMLVEKRDPYTWGHQNRVGLLAYAIAIRMGYSPEYAHGIEIAGYLHDVGKITVPIEILSKPGSISEDEFRLIKVHPAVGYEILKDIDLDWPIAQTVLQHHERLDGSGYPNGLKGDAISMDARIVGVADVFEAMTSHRPYRPAASIEEALDVLTSKKGILFDEKVVDTFLALHMENQLGT
jgi:PAS domain S-box-containing protein